MPLRTLSSDKFPEVVGQHLVVPTKYATENRDVVNRFGRAVAQGTEWGLDNKAAVIELCGTVAPEETEDKAFAEVIYDRVAELVTLPAAANGKYGQIDEAA